MIAIFGPTASGKSKLAIDLANKINGEIINMDSMQIYKKLLIGTAKPTKEELLMAKHHLYDFIEPDENYSAYDYKIDALKKIEEIESDKKIPILVGGTGLYLSSLYYNFEFRKKNAELEKEYSIEEMYNKLDDDLRKKIDKNNRHRVINAFTSNKVYDKKNRTKSDLDIKIIYTYTPRDILYNNINNRVDIMIKKGLIDEVEYLIKDVKLGRNSQSMKAIGYKEVIDFLDGNLEKNEMIEILKRNTRRYAKRQITWLKNQYDTYSTFDMSKYAIESLIKELK